MVIQPDRIRVVRMLRSRGFPITSPVCLAYGILGGAQYLRRAVRGEFAQRDPVRSKTPLVRSRT